jgi:hypothetical protein
MFTAEAYKPLAMYFDGKMWAKACQVLFATQKLGCAVVTTVLGWTSVIILFADRIKALPLLDQVQTSFPLQNLNLMTYEYKIMIVSCTVLSYVACQQVHIRLK